MKNFTVLLLMSFLLLSVGCNKDDNNFDYPLADIYGTWDATHIYADGKWIDITGVFYQKFAMSATFYSDGTYDGEGYLGTGSGTYMTDGATITTYISDKPYLIYNVVSLKGSNAEVSMSMSGESSTLKAKLKKR